MYKTVITLKSDIPNESLDYFHSLTANAFNNRAGIAVNISNETRRFVFEGDDALYGCLQLGVLTLYRAKDFINHVLLWEWIDEEPSENCDVLRELSVPVN